MTVNSAEHRPSRTTPLEKAMLLHQPGQITWPEPDLNLKCAACRHFYDQSKIKDGTAKGRCALVKAHHKRQGVKFRSTAIACPQFSRGVSA